MKNYIILILMIILSSCLTVSRWSEFSEEIKDKELPLLVKENIFYDFLWTTPPLYSQKINFKNEKEYKSALIYFTGNTYKININEKGFIILNNNEVIKPNKSKKNIYYNLDILNTKLVHRQRLVTKTHYVSKTVTIWETIPIQRSRTVTTFNPDGTTSFRTEFYTDFQTRSRTEIRWVPETYTTWETVMESVIDIPFYTYYELNLDGINVIIYKVIEGENTNYYMQNVTYYSAKDIQETFWGETEVKLLFIDSNSNGIYFEDDDNVLFNTWNPYEQKSEFREVPNYMDNYWYKLRELKIDRFLSFSLNDTKNKLLLKNANSKYIDTASLGKIKLYNIPEDAVITLNGEWYLHSADGKFLRNIEYGVYNLKIEYEGYLDFTSTFIIDEKTPEYYLEYKLPKKGGTFVLEPEYLRNWKIIITDNKENEKIYYNQTRINLEEGEYTVTISAIGYNLVKKIKIEIGKEVLLNYADEIEKISKKNN